MTQCPRCQNRVPDGTQITACCGISLFTPRPQKVRLLQVGRRVLTLRRWKLALAGLACAAVGAGLTLLVEVML